MYKNKIINTMLFPINTDTKGALLAIKNAGFDGVSTDYFYTLETIDEVAEMIKEAGLEYTCIHAPFLKTHLMWSDDDSEAKEFMDEIFKCLDDAYHNRVARVVMHAYVFDPKHPTDNPKAFSRFKEILDYAFKRNITICLENTNNNEYFFALMNKFLGKHKALAFCFDCGHQNLYSFSKGFDFYDKYHDYLRYTHLHDNDGITDSHILVGDGNYDFNKLADMMNKFCYKGDFTLETIPVKANPSEKTSFHAQYEKMSADEFYKLAYERLIKLLVSKVE